MSLSRMKPLPKFIAVAVIVGVVVVGGKYAFSLLPKSEPAPTPAVAIPVPAEKSDAGQAAIVVTPTPTPAGPPAVVPAPVTNAAPAGLTQPGTADAGLANILGTKK